MRHEDVASLDLDWCARLRSHTRSGADDRRLARLYNDGNDCKKSDALKETAAHALHHHPATRRNRTCACHRNIRRRPGRAAADAAPAAAPQHAVYLPLVVRPEPYPPVNRAWELEFIRLLNEERARHGLHPLREHPLLALAARRHAYDVGINQMSRGPEYCSHTGTDGTEPGDRVRQTGYPGLYAGEAISCGRHEVYYAVQGLLNSPPHRAILLDPIPVEIGVGAHPIISDVEWRRGSHSTVMLSGTPRP